MTRRRKRPLYEVSFQMTPMIDMTFLLLIFFMVTQRITEQELSVPVKLRSLSPLQSQEKSSATSSISTVRGTITSVTGARAPGKSSPISR